MYRTRITRLLVVPAFAALLLAYAGGCDARHDPEVSIIDLEVGTGAEAHPGDSLWVYYTGWLWRVNGTRIDSVQPPSKPEAFLLGSGRSGNNIEGWNQGIQGMRVGGRRLITVPPELGYGGTAILDPNDTTQVLIPANSTLVFEVDLVNAETPEP